MPEFGAVEPIDLNGKNGEKSVVRSSLEQVLINAEGIKSSTSEYERITYERAHSRVSEIMGYLQSGLLNNQEAQNILAGEIASPEIKGLIDSLSGLFNENGVNMRLAASINHAERTDEPLSIAYLDLIGFKAINDDKELGHGVGDRAIIHAGSYFTNLVRGDDFVGRLHGDEYVAGFTGGDLPGVQSRFQGEVLTTELAKFVQEKIRAEQDMPDFKGKVIDPMKVAINARVGFATYAKGDNVSGLKQRADDNMNANRTGKSTR